MVLIFVLTVSATEKTCTEYMHRPTPPKRNEFTVKKIHSLITVTALIADLATSLPAQTTTTITNNPYTELNPARATITLTMTNVPTTNIYIQQYQITALESLANRPTTTQYNATAQL
jgi:hypothetical protein